MSDTIFMAPKALEALHKLVEHKTAAMAAQLNHAAIFGMEIRPLPSWWPTGEQWEPDWRERLDRNCNRPSTGRWEPLTYTLPDVYIIDRNKPWPGILGGIISIV